MSLTRLTSNDTNGNSTGQLLSGNVNVRFKVVELVRDTNLGGLQDATEFTYNEYEQVRGYDLNDPYQYGAFVEDSANGFEEYIPARRSAWTDLLDPQTSVQRKQQILDLGKPYRYENTRRLAVVTKDGNVVLIPDQSRIIIYEYDYNNTCERLDFDEKVVPGVNANNPNSPCNAVSEPTESVITQVTTALLSSSFIDFDDFTAGYKSLFQEIGFRSGSVGEFTAFNPKRFEFVSQSLILDEFEDVTVGPVRVIEEIIDGERGTTRTDLVVLQTIQKRNLRTGEIVTGSGAEEEVFRRTIDETPEAIYVYKRLDTSTIRTATLYNNTVGAWNGDGTLYTFYTNSLQTDLEKSYKLEVLSGSCAPNKMFTIYYGDFSGHGTSKLSDDRKEYGYSKSIYSMISSLVGNTLTNKIFFTDNSNSQSLYLLEQLKNLNASDLATFINTNFVLGYDPTGYGNINFIENFDSIELVDSNFYYKPAVTSTAGPILLRPIKSSEKIFAIQINQELLKNSIDEGNFELSLAELSGSNIEVNNTSGNVLKLIDSSRQYDIILEGDTKDSNRFKTGFTGQVSYDLVSGSLVGGIYSNASPVVYGKVYPGYGLIVLDANKLNDELNFGIVSQSNTDGMNPFRLFTSISGAAAPTSVRSELMPFTLRQVDSKIVDSIEILLNKNDFNYSTNPSYYSNRERSPFFRPAGQTNFANGRLYDGTLRFRQWFYEPITYITTVGLYNDNYQLLAIGKLSKPIKKSFDTSVKLKVNIAY